MDNPGLLVAMALAGVAGVAGGYLAWRAWRFYQLITETKTGQLQFARQGLAEIVGLNAGRDRDRVVSKYLEKHRKDFREYLTVDKDVAVADPQSDPNLDQLGIKGELAELLGAQNLGSLQAIERYGDLESIAGMSPQQAAEVTRAIEAWRQATARLRGCAP